MVNEGAPMGNECRVMRGMGEGETPMGGAYGVMRGHLWGNEGAPMGVMRGYVWGNECRVMRGLLW